MKRLKFTLQYYTCAILLVAGKLLELLAFISPVVLEIDINIRRIPGG